MFHRFSKSARQVVAAAVTEAQRRGDRRLGTQHLLLGLLQEPRSPAAEVLGVTVARAREALRAMDLEAMAAVGVDASGVVPVDSVRKTGRLPFTAAARSTLERALREGVRRNARRLEPRDLLVALLICSPPDPTATLLSRLDVDRDAVRRQLDEAA